jgi:hypothetical protein
MIHNETLWMLFDALTALIAINLYNRTRYWLPFAIYATSVMQLIFHSLYWDWSIINQDWYYLNLDALFQAQVAAFILAGGPSVWNRACDFLIDRGVGGRSADALAKEGVRTNVTTTP